MESSAVTVTLALTIGKLGYDWCNYWWNKKSRAARYVDLANDELRLVDASQNGLDLPVELDEVCPDARTDQEIESAKPVRRVVRHRGMFRSYLVQQGKAKFGSPRRTTANVLCVRKYLYDLCVEHGLLARHIVENLNFATEAVFVPTKDELLALAVHHTSLAKIRGEVADELGGPTPSD